jgi:D-alanyl-D-alanine carboxypeptidase (penicillin-binding protein 5/6)
VRFPPTARLVASLLAVPVLLAAGAPARAQVTTAPPPPPPPLPRSYVLVDDATGAVIAERDARVPLRPASTSKILTAIAAVDTIPPASLIPVSARAEGMPARKINLKTGQRWRFDDLLHALLLVSANDAAVALAERSAGTVEGFGAVLERTARRLHLEDHPVLRDPSGLDDEFSVDGGNLLSARDLAIAARALLRYPTLAPIVATPEFRFDGGDGKPHVLRNHNRLLVTYPGAVGIKTGATKRAGRSLVAAATRDGRTMIVVVIHAVDTYASATALLDQGFATPPAALASLDHLPDVSPRPVPGSLPATPTTAPRRQTAAVPARGAESTVDHGPWYSDDAVQVALAVMATPVALAGLLRLRVRRRRRRRRLQRELARQRW